MNITFESIFTKDHTYNIFNAADDKYAKYINKHIKDTVLQNFPYGKTLSTWIELPYII